ncbi:FAD binding domain, partial [Musa troglodytarum]
PPAPSGLPSLAAAPPAPRPPRPSRSEASRPTSSSGPPRDLSPAAAPSPSACCPSSTSRRPSLTAASPACAFSPPPTAPPTSAAPSGPTSISPCSAAGSSTLSSAAAPPTPAPACSRPLHLPPPPLIRLRPLPRPLHRLPLHPRLPRRHPLRPRRRCRHRYRFPGADPAPPGWHVPLRGPRRDVRRRRRLPRFLRLGLPQMRPRGRRHRHLRRQARHQAASGRDPGPGRAQDCRGGGDPGGGAPDPGAPEAATGGGAGGASGRRSRIRHPVLRRGDLLRRQVWADVREAIVRAWKERGVVTEADLKTEYLRKWDEEYGGMFRFLGLLQQVFYGSNAGREALVELCADEYVQRMTFESYLYKRMARGDWRNDLGLAWRTIGSLVRAGLWVEVDRLRGIGADSS